MADAVGRPVTLYVYDLSRGKSQSARVFSFPSGPEVDFSATGMARQVRTGYALLREYAGTTRCSPYSFPKARFFCFRPPPCSIVSTYQ